MRDTFLRLLSDNERNILYDMMEDEEDNGKSELPCQNNPTQG